MYKKIVLFNSGLLLIIAIIFVQYYVNPKQQKIYFPQQQWQAHFSPSFSFTVKDHKKKYRLSLVLTYNQKYDFQNLYIQCTLQNKNKNITDAVHEIQLFHPIIGNPLGKGFLKNKSQTIIFLDDYPLTHQTPYTLQVQPLMRKKILQGLISIRLAIQSLP